MCSEKTSQEADATLSSEGRTASTAHEIFEAAGVSVSENHELFEQCVSILNQKMATLSATLGLSAERVTLFDEQKKSLIQDLIGMKAAGKLAAAVGDRESAATPAAGA